MVHVIDSFMYVLENQEAFAMESRVKAALWDPDKDAWKRICVSFLKSRLWQVDNARVKDVKVEKQEVL